MEQNERLAQVVAVVYDINLTNQMVSRNKVDCSCITDLVHVLVLRLRKFLEVPALGQEHTVDYILIQVTNLLRNARRLIVACSYVTNNDGDLTAVGSGKNVVEARLLPLKLHEMKVRIAQLTEELANISEIGRSVTGGTHNNHKDTEDTGNSLAEPAPSSSTGGARCSFAADNPMTWTERQVRFLGTKEPAEVREAAVMALHTRMLELGADVAPFVAELVSVGALPPLAHLLGSGTDGAKEHAAAVLWHCAKDTAYRGLVVSAEAVPRLAGLLTHSRGAVREQAVGALSCLAWDPGGRRGIVGSNAVPTLSGMLALGSPRCVMGATATLWALTADQTAVAAVTGVPGTVERLLALLLRCNSAVIECATGALWNLARGL